MNTVSSPHDRLFKGAMADVRIAREFLTYYLPIPLRSAVDLDTLVLCPNSYVDNELALTASDVLYKATIAGEEGYVYLLCEHQSTVDVLMAFRVWQYIVAIWADHLKQTNGKKLPLVIPLVFYHGQQPYTANCDIRDLIQAPPALIDNVLFQPFTLIDTHDLPDETLREQHWAGIMAFVMKHIFARDALGFLQQILDHLRQFEQEEAGDYVILLLNYLLTAGDTEQIEKVVTIIQQRLSQTTGAKIMTIAERLTERGIQQGEATMLMRLLQHKFGPLPNQYRRQLETADASRLLLWGEQVLEADSLEKLFGE